MSKSILIVEDSSAIRDLLKFSLEPEGYTLFTAENGKSALNIVDKKELDLIITDLQMPIMTGFELIQEIKTRGTNIPIIAITAYNNSSAEMEAISNKVYMLLEKPLDLMVLLGIIKEAINKPK